MKPEKVGTHAQNTQNSPIDGRRVDSVYCVQGLGAIENLFDDLRAAGVELSIDRDGRLAFDAPADVMTPELLARVRAERDGLMALILGGRFAATSEPSGVSCPFCRSELLEDVEPGWRCMDCKRLAWVWLPGGSIVRVDCERMNL
jgi:hypothetical protein